MFISKHSFCYDNHHNLLLHLQHTSLGYSVFMKALRSIVYFAFFVFFFTLGSTVYAASFQGTVLSALPCNNISGFLLTLTSSAEPVFYQAGVSRSTLSSFPPAPGTGVSGVTSSVNVQCNTGSTTSTTTSLQRILYIRPTSIQGPSTLTPTPSSIISTSPTNPTSNSSPSAFSGIFTQAGNNFSSILSNTINQSIQSVASSIGAGAAKALGGSGGGGLPFGGMVTSPPIPCLIPPGAYKIILGPPSPGIYMYQAGLTKSYSYGPPLHPGQWVLGTAVPATCVTSLGGVPIPVKLIISHGSSI